MIKWIIRLLWPCNHDWNKEIDVERRTEYPDGSHYTKLTYLYKCKKCGKFKKIVL
jgi:hypothetical protein